MPLTFAETPLYYKDSQGNYHRILSGADMTGYRTASAQDAIDAAQDADIASRAKTDEIGIVITGARPAVAVTAGQYVIVRSSTITGITDGLYTAVNALSPSTDVTAADLTVVSGGGLNGLRSVYSDTIILNGWTYPVFRVPGASATLLDLALPYPYTAVKSYNFTTAKLFDNGAWKDVSVSSCGIPAFQSKCVRILFNLNGVTLTQDVLLANIVGTIVLE